MRGAACSGQSRGAFPLPIHGEREQRVKFTIAGECTARLILAVAHGPTLEPSPACDGVYGSNSATRQTIGAWKAGLMLGDLVQEVRSDRCGQAPQSGHVAGCCECALMPSRAPRGDRNRSEAAKHGPEHKSPHAG